VLEGIPLGRMGTKEDIAWLAMFLSSPYGGYISGAVIPCDGGRSFAGAAMIEEAGKVDAAQKAAAKTGP
jgi:NAD(P)-dependent dehydrogenase (short-subunit alcohol dehydrogenase family)